MLSVIKLGSRVPGLPILYVEPHHQEKKILRWERGNVPSACNASTEKSLLRTHQIVPIRVATQNIPTNVKYSYQRKIFLPTQMPAVSITNATLRSLTETPYYKRDPIV